MCTKAAAASACRCASVKPPSRTAARAAPYDAGEVTITGYGASFEANFLWRVEGPSGTEEGYTLSDEGMGFGELEFTVDLAPGSYTVTVENTSGMGEGFVPHTDSKTFTVR